MYCYSSFLPYCKAPRTVGVVLGRMSLSNADSSSIYCPITNTKCLFIPHISGCVLNCVLSLVFTWDQFLTNTDLGINSISDTGRFNCWAAPVISLYCLFTYHCLHITNAEFRISL